MTFTLHPDLKRDGIKVGEFSLCQVLLINDAYYPWFVLVPMREGICDIIDLTPEDDSTLWAESRAFSQAIMKAFNGEKLKVAALGNMTPQLHIHHIVRYKSDAAWPAPIWGKHALTPYTPKQIGDIRSKLAAQAIKGFIQIKTPRLG